MCGVFDNPDFRISHGAANPLFHRCEPIAGIKSHTRKQVDGRGPPPRVVVEGRRAEGIKKLNKVVPERLKLTGVPFGDVFPG